MSRQQTVLIAGLAVLILAFLVRLSLGDLSNNETTLLGLLLFLVSVAATWIVGHAYSESAHRGAIAEVREEHKANLRTYGLNALEKVTNLSSQLSRLAAYLQDGLDSSEFDSEGELLRAREERLETAIHELGTLKSVNDTTLSDWKGVIGEELEEQREEREEREEEVRELIERVQQMEEHWVALSQARIPADSATAGLRSEVEDVRKELRRLLSSVGGPPVKKASKRTRRKIRDVEQECPKCGASLSYEQKASGGSKKTLKCPSCGTELYSLYSKVRKEFYLETEKEKLEQVNCPVCGGEFNVQLGIFPGQTTDTTCEDCTAMLRVVRAADKVKARPISELTGVPQAKEAHSLEQVIELVRQRLPAQPWPQNTSKKVAEELNLPVTQVQKAVSELIRRGVFKRQIDGKLYELVEVRGHETETDVSEEGPQGK